MATASLRFIVLLLCLRGPWFAGAFLAPKGQISPVKSHSIISEGTSLNLFEDDDVSAFNALCQFGPAPFFIRITQPDKYWEAVDKFETEERVSRVIAVRNMDAYFADPIGWGLKRGRAKDFGEVVDYTRKTGVQKRPIFSLFMLCLTSWFFLLFLPTRISELGGLKPSALNGGLCPPDVRVFDENGKQQFECKPKTFQDAVMTDQKKY